MGNKKTEKNKRNIRLKRRFAEDASRFTDAEIMDSRARNGLCPGQRQKINYATEGEAWAAVVVIHQAEANMVAYECGECPHWHIGHGRYVDRLHREAMIQRVEIARGPIRSSCKWPIVDDSIAEDALIVEAVQSLDAHLEERGLELVGFPDFSRWADYLCATYLAKVA